MVQEPLINLYNRCFRQLKVKLFTTYNKWKVPFQAVHENIMLQLHTVCRSCCLESLFIHQGYRIFHVKTCAAVIAAFTKAEVRVSNYDPDIMLGSGC